MKVFISWSGELSKKISKELKSWLQLCIQSLDVFYSEQDIEKGDMWNEKITEELSETNYGIVCLTDANKNSPWLHFESGALSKQLNSKVATIAVNINLTDIKGPLTSFQATKLEETDMYKLLESINANIERPLNENLLKVSFDAFWPGFINNVNNIIENYNQKADKNNSKINVADAVEEILKLVRNQNKVINSLPNINIEEIINNLSYNAKNNIYEEVYYQIFDFSVYLLSLFKENKIKDRLVFVKEYVNFLDKLYIERTYNKRKFKQIIEDFKKEISYVEYF